MAVDCLLGVIADDYTGGSDVAAMVSEGGVRTVQVFGLQEPGFIEELRGRYQAAVICLKSRSNPAAEARRQSIEALGLLELLEPRQIHFKYCSTFDSTPEGNIGPVIDALMSRMGIDFTVAVPALPVNERTQYLGHLFAGAQLLSESHMRHHPVTPMTDSNLVRLLGAQTGRRVGLILLGAVQAGGGRLAAEIERARQSGVEIALLDAVSDADVAAIAEACAGLRLITGSSALPMCLPAVWRSRGWLAPAPDRAASVSERVPLQAEAELRGHPLPHPAGRDGSVAKPVLVLSGSCAASTLRQIEELRACGCRCEAPDVARLVQGEAGAELDRLYERLRPEVMTAGVAAVVASADHQTREQTRRGLSAEQAAALPLAIEAAFGELARRFAAEGVERLVIAGGETAGAIIDALGIRAVEVTAILDPGVPAVRAIGGPDLRLALKSGNFGSPDFFPRAIRCLTADG
jgi:uncharacterized protein YgbK (DUF1537 family)